MLMHGIVSGQHTFHEYSTKTSNTCIDRDLTGATMESRFDSQPSTSARPHECITERKDVSTNLTLSKKILRIACSRCRYYRRKVSSPVIYSTATY